MVKHNSHKKLSSKSKKNSSLKGGDPSKRGSKNKRSRSGTQKKRRTVHMGGSVASDLVNQASTSPAVVNDFVTSPRIRDGPMADTYSDQVGGSNASDMVMSQLGNEATTNSYPSGYSVKGNMDSLNMYQTTGGNRRNKKNNNNRKNRSSRNNRNTRNSHNNRSRSNSKQNNNNKNRKQNNNNMRGGGSDWITSQYSLGSYNGPEMSAGDVAKFSQSTAGSRADYMNPPNLGTAGSGYPMGSLEGANVRMTGSPLV